MKLEFESNASTFSPVGSDVFNEKQADNKSAEILEMLNAGIKSAQEGRRAEARDLLLRVTEADAENENAWLWLASISEYPEELMVFLNSVLKINPDNRRAQDWAKATRTLLSKTCVQRGIDASRESQKDFARQCFLQAIVHDNQNEMAWLWLASVSDTDEEKAMYLQKVLDIDPENATARASLKSIKKHAAEALLQKAFAQAARGENERALDSLQEVFHHTPEIQDAWVLKSFLVASCAEKIQCFEKALAINSANNLAYANLEFLRSMTAEVESKAEQAIEIQPAENLSEAEANEESVMRFDAPWREHNLPEDENPIQETQFSSYQVEENEAEEEAQAVFEAAAEELEAFETGKFEFKNEENFEEDFNPDTEFSAGIQKEAEAFFETEENFAAEVQFELEPEETVENLHFEDAGYAAQPDDFASVQHLPDVYAFEEPQERKLSEKDFEAAMHKTEPSDFYSNLEESASETEEVFAEEDAADVYEIEADELFAAAKDLEEEIEIAAPLSAAKELEVFEETETFAAEEAQFHEENEPFAAEEEKNFTEESLSHSHAEMTVCPFCSAKNDQLAFVCDGCRAVLTFSDLEMILAPRDVDEEALDSAIRQVEMVKTRRDLEAEELKLLAVGYCNLKNPKKGLLYLNEAARIDPDDIVLGSQVNALKIRLSEMERQEMAHVASPKNRTILVVDDSATVRKLISGKLEKSGHEVVCAVDGVDALEKLKEISPDLILLDISMPRMDGYQVCKLIRSNEELKDVPVVMISGKDGFFDKVRGRMAGTTGYITKPFGPETLMKTVENYIVEPV